MMVRMNKKQLVVALVIISFFTLGSAQNSISGAAQQDQSIKNETEELLDTLTEITIKTEREQMTADLEAWTDQKMIKSFSKIPMSDKYIKNLYKEFKRVIVTPPNPDTYKEYAIENAEESLIKVEALGKKMHNLFLALSEEDFAKYGKMVGIMREALCFNWENIPYAIKHNNGRDIYWFELHNIYVEEAQKEYARLFEQKNN